MLGNTAPLARIDTELGALTRTPTLPPVHVSRIACYTAGNYVITLITSLEKPMPVFFSVGLGLYLLGASPLAKRIATWSIKETNVAPILVPICLIGIAATNVLAAYHIQMPLPLVGFSLLAGAGMTGFSFLLGNARSTALLAPASINVSCVAALLCRIKATGIECGWIAPIATMGYFLWKEQKDITSKTAEQIARLISTIFTSSVLSRFLLWGCEQLQTDSTAGNIALSIGAVTLLIPVSIGITRIGYQLSECVLARYRMRARLPLIAAPSASTSTALRPDPRWVPIISVGLFKCFHFLFGDSAMLAEPGGIAVELYVWTVLFLALSVLSYTRIHCRFFQAAPLSAQEDGSAKRPGYQAITPDA